MPIVNSANFPDIPKEVLAEYPYAAIYANSENSDYALGVSKKEWCYVHSDISDINFSVCYGQGTIKTYVLNDGNWASETEVKEGYFNLSKVYPVWSNHNIYKATAFDTSTLEVTIGTELYYTERENLGGLWFPKLPNGIFGAYPYGYIIKVVYNDTKYYLISSDKELMYGSAELCDKLGFTNANGQCGSEGAVLTLGGGAPYLFCGGLSGIWQKSSVYFFNPCPMGESEAYGASFQLIWANHDVYEVVDINTETLEITKGGIYFDNKTIITNNKYYKAIASKIRSTLKNTTQYKPSKLPSAIRSTKDIVDSYNQIGIKSGAFLYGDGSVKIIGDKMYTGLYCGADIDTALVPDNITEISNCAFAYSNISNIVLHDNVTKLGKEAFANCVNLTEVILPNNITSIDGSCFNGCENLTSVSLPTNLTTLKYMVFYNCSSLLSMVIPTGVVELDTSTFYGCTNLVKVDASNCTTIADNVFENCSVFDTLILRNTGKVCTLENTNSFTDTLIESGIGYIYVPSALLENYKTAENWSTYATQFRAIEDYPEICNPTE